MSRLWLGLLVCGTLWAGTALDTAAAESTTASEPKLTAKGVEYFESKIRPVLTQRCYSCHSAQAKEVKGGLLLDTRDGLRKGGESGAGVVPGNVAESLIIQAIKHETYEMPPGDKLADSVISDFEEWVKMGAPDPRIGKAAAWKKTSLAEARSFWSFQRPVKVPAPSVRDSAWPRTDIDRFVLARLEETGLRPVADADRATLARRIYFDLNGLPPSPEEVDAFVKDASVDAVARLIDRLLERTEFGERWGRHWLDVVRFGESTGKERNIPFPYAWRYRDYVIDSFNEDKPYDRFIREQVAGDLLRAASTDEKNENLIATGFLAIGTKSLNERNREQYLMDVADEQIDVTSRAVLGMTIACARCHDHKFDPITQTDYYAVAGIFRSTEVMAGVKPGNNKTGYDAEYGRMATNEPKPKLNPQQQAEIEKLTAQLKEDKALQARAEQFLARNNSTTKTPANKSASSKITAGKGAAADSSQSASDKGSPGQKNRKQNDETDKVQKAERLVKRLDAKIAETEAQLKKLRDTGAANGDPVMAVCDATKPVNCRVNIRGEVRELGEEVPRGVPVVLSFDRIARFDTQHSGRVQLASWLVSRDNPLTARVMANRVWAHLFGRGIVESVDNFGTLGDEPTHPQLLDQLAIRFMENGWSVKTMIKEIMLSRAYQMSSVHDAKNYAADPDNRMIWRMNRRRLEAEAIRDSILAVSGKLDLKRPAGSLVQAAAASAEVGRNRRSEPDLSKYLHRSVYLPYVRGRMPDILTVFDVADPSLIVGQREVTTVAPQALFMMNSPIVIQHAASTAQRVLYQALPKDEQRIDYAYRLILGRPPTSDQKERSLEFLQTLMNLTAESESTTQDRRNAAWASLCQTLMASGEFRYVY